MRVADCHPTEKYYAKGKCKKCYHRDVNATPSKLAWFRTHRLKKHFNINDADYNRMLDAQNGVCWICKRPSKQYRLAVDHNHDTGKVRGLLCTPCNRVVGYLENSSWMESATTYLATHS